MLRRSALAAVRRRRATSREPATDRVLDEVVPFLEAPPLEPDQSEAYRPAVGLAARRRRCSSTAIRAIDRALKYGAHGLPLIGSGDWNDGMNRVGHAGRGESVWLGWFLVVVLNEFAALCERAQATPSARSAIGARPLARPGMLELAWDGDWYRRAYFDDGTPLGSAQNEECRIDSLTQSWAVFSQDGATRGVPRGRWRRCAPISSAATRSSCCC